MQKPMPNILAPRTFALLWIGILVGLYGIEFPARFGSDEATYTAALDIGRRVFERLSVVELGLWVVMAAAVVISRVRRQLWIAIAALGMILLIERLLLLPELVQRSADIVAGMTLPDSDAHSWYSRLEALKAIALASLVIWGGAAKARPPVAPVPADSTHAAR